MEQETCSRCSEKSNSTVKTQYGDICSIKCFRELCDDILGASEEDFIIE